jgi:hypothetical protein
MVEQDGPVKALRLTFVREGDQLRLHSTTPVEMRVPPGDRPARPDERGFWAELRDAADQPLFRRVLRDPLPEDTEVFAPDPARSVARAPVAPSQAVFSVVVPDVPASRSVVLFSSRHTGASVDARTARLAAVRQAAEPPATPIARFSLGGEGGGHGHE